MATRSYDRPRYPEMGVGARAGRAFAYVLLVVTCTVIAGLGGYQVGTRAQPEATAPTSVDVDVQVAAAVERQKAKDRALRRQALIDFEVFQRTQFEAELSRRVNEVRLAEAQNAARAYRRGKEAGAATAAVEATDKANEKRVDEQ